MFQGVWTAGLTWSTRWDRQSQRHQTDYEILKKLGSGGFGRVYHVKHRLDGREYALKVVPTNSSSDPNEMDKMLREVQVLSSIQSHHVVRYFSAWIEQGDIAVDHLGTSDDETSSDWDITNNASVSQSEIECLNCVKNPICNLCQTPYKDWEVTLEQWGLIDAVLQPLDLCVDCYKKSIPKDVDVDVSKISIRETRVRPECLYILMEHCHFTLPDAVREFQHEESVIWSLFGQILEGLAHLHANGVIHRDVKPSNIFVHENQVKIGDLGLATTLIVHRPEGNKIVPTAQSETLMSSEVGTFLYCAPEIVQGKRYDEKADIYSLGVLLVEIFHSFATGMERAEVLGDLRQGIFPAEWTSRHEYARDLAQRMLRTDPSLRPNCFEILLELQSKGLCEHHATKHLVGDLQAQVRTLQETVEMQGGEISRLRKLLDENNITY